MPTALGAEAMTLNELPERLHEFDIVVTCTASTLPIIGKGLLERVVKQRKHAPVFIVDLGVPRDVEPEAAELDDVFLYSIDELQVIVKENLQVRREAVVQAEQMIADQTEHFLQLARRPHVVPTIEALSGHHDDLRSSGARARAPHARGRRVARRGARGARARPHEQAPARAAVGAQRGGRRRARASSSRALSRVYRLDSPDGEP